SCAAAVEARRTQTSACDSTARGQHDPSAARHLRACVVIAASYLICIGVQWWFIIYALSANRSLEECRMRFHRLNDCAFHRRDFCLFMAAAFPLGAAGFANREDAKP